MIHNLVLYFIDVHLHLYVNSYIILHPKKSLSPISQQTTTFPFGESTDGNECFNPCERGLQYIKYWEARRTFYRLKSGFGIS